MWYMVYHTWYQVYSIACQAWHNISHQVWHQVAVLRWARLGEKSRQNKTAALNIYTYSRRSPLAGAISIRSTRTPPPSPSREGGSLALRTLASPSLVAIFRIKSILTDICYVISYLRGRFRPPPRRPRPEGFPERISLTGGCRTPCPTRALPRTQSPDKKTEKKNNKIKERNHGTSHGSNSE